MDHTYTPDFPIVTRSGKKIYVEAKGRFDQERRRAMRWGRKCNPDMDLRFLFQNANTKIHARAKLTLGEWATREGFEWASGTTVPESWLDE